MSITPMMSAICADDALMASMVWITCPTACPPAPAMFAASMASTLAWRALSAFCCTVELSSSMADAVCSSALACSSVRDDKSILPAAICDDAVAMVSVPLRTCCTISSRLPFMMHSASSSLPVSSPP